MQRVAGRQGAGPARGLAKRLAALATLEGLRAAILVQAYGLRSRGPRHPARLRQALAAVALRKAFGGETAAAVAGKSGLPARASRLLAAQLLDKPRDPGTDRRLVSALAAAGLRGARHRPCGAARRAFCAASSARRLPRTGRRRGAIASPARQRSVATVAVARRRSAAPRRGTSTAARRGATALTAVAGVPRGLLDLPGFATEVRRLAAGEAQGWSGDRKAYISRVWRTVRERRPEWGLSEIEFKCMLAEAHRSGQLGLANADLKDESNIKDVQDSAVIYRNAVFHFIRVDA